MQTKLTPGIAATPEGQAADAVLRKCVHCGFCNATCPTYQLLGDELDGPRGRIYLIKQMLEGERATRSTQMHLDRCLTCRNCETTCPSGVEYGVLLDIGRQLAEHHVARPTQEKVVRWALREGLTSRLFKPAVALGRWARPLLPVALRVKLPARAPALANEWPTRTHARKVLLLAGCVQPTLMPNINSATARVLDAAGIQTLVAAGASCCGAIRTHLADAPHAHEEMRRNIDAWWPLVERGEVEAIVSNASGCGLMLKDYGQVLARDTYADKARRISEITRDVSELLPDIAPRLKGKLRSRREKNKLAFHPPCTLQHGQRVNGVVEMHLAQLGFELQLAARDGHLCCGSAGTYSITQPKIALALRDRKLKNLSVAQPEAIVSANIGCIQHLQSGTALPVRHWIEALDDALSKTGV